MGKSEIRGIKLGDYLTSLKKTRSTSKFRRAMGVYPPHFYFFHQILTNSRIPKSIDVVLWILFGFTADMIVVLMPSHVQWFHSLYHTDPNDGHVHLTGKVFTQQSAFTLIMFGIAILVFQAISFIRYKRDNKRCLSVLEASILSVTYFQLSPLLIMIYGIIFGCLLLISIRDDLDLTSIVCAVFTILTAFACFASSMYFQKTVRCSIVMYTGMFTFWKYPLTAFDHMYFFMSACFFTLVCGIHTRGMMGMPLIQIVYGLGIFLQMQLPFFISFFGNFVTYKLGLDAVGFGIMSAIDLYYGNIPIAPFLSFQVFYYFLTGCLASLLLTVIFQRQKEKVYNRKFQGYQAITSPEKALAHFRTGVLYGVPIVRDLEYLRWLVGYRFSELMIPDVVRFCIVAGIDLNELVLPGMMWGNNTLYSLKFLAFQLELQEKNVLPDDHEIVTKIASEMEQEVKRIKGLIRVFWTEDDVERLTLLDLGREIRQVNEQFAFNAWIYAESKRIREIWADYRSNIMYDSEAGVLYMKDRMRETILGSNSVYSWLNPQREEVSEQKPVATERMTDRLFRNIRNEWTGPFVWVWAILGAIVVLGAMAENYYYIHDMNNWWETFLNSTYTSTLSSTIAGDLLVQVEGRVILPSAQRIAKLLGISEAEANELKRSKFVPKYNKSEAHRMLIHLNTDIEPEDKIGTCESVGLVSIVALGAPDSKSEEYRYCYYVNLETYRRKLRDFAFSFGDSLAPRSIPGYHIMGYILIALFVITFVPTMVFGCKDRQKRRQVLKIVRIASARKPKMRVFEKLDYSFSVALQILLCIIATGLFSVLLLVYYYSAGDIRAVVEDIARQYTALAQICSDCQYGLAVAHMMTLSEPMLANTTFLQEVLIHVSLDIIDSVQSLINETMTKSFSLLSPLNTWVTGDSFSLSSQILDFAFAISSGPFTEVSYDLLRARYIFYTIIDDITNNVIPVLAGVSEMEVQERVSLFIVVVFFIIVAFWMIVYFQFVLRRRKDLWFSSALSVLMFEIGLNPYKFSKLISKNKRKILCEIPLPVAIRDRQKRITYCNAKFAQIFRFAKTQMTGQRFASDGPVLEVDGHVFDVEIRDFGNCDFVILNEKTEANQAEIKYQQLRDRLIPTFPQKVPFKETVRYFELLVDPLKAKVDDVVAHFKRVDDFPFVRMISNGSSFLTALVASEATTDEIVGFVARITEGMEAAATTALTEDVAIISSVNQGLVVASGPAVLRAHYCVLNGVRGSFYCDESIIPMKDDMHLENGVSVIHIGNPYRNTEQ